MGILFSMTLNQKIKYSDKLFYDQYKYSIQLLVPFYNSISYRIALNKQLSHTKIDAISNIFVLGGKTFGIPQRINQHRIKRITELNNWLHKACNYFITHRADIKLSFCRRHVQLYTNSEIIPYEMVHDKQFTVSKITKIEIDRPRNTIYGHHSSDSEVRCYLKTTKDVVNTKGNLIKFIDANAQNIKLSPCLQRFVDTEWRRSIRPYYFIDLADYRLTSVLQLMVPGILRKTLGIVLR